MMEVFEASFLKHFQLLKKYKYLKFCRSGGTVCVCPSLQQAVAAVAKTLRKKRAGGGNTSKVLAQSG